MTAAPFCSRWSPGESLQRPRGTRVDRGAKGRLDVKSGSCSLLTICRSGIMFPWMNSRTADFKQSAGKDGLGVRRGRTAFTRHQLLELEKEFHLSPYLARPRRLEVAAGLKLSDHQVKIWFQNRRVTHRKEHKDAKAVARRASRRSSRDRSRRSSSSEDLMSFHSVATTSGWTDLHLLDRGGTASSLFRSRSSTTDSADSSHLSYVPPSFANGLAGSCAGACSQSPRCHFKVALEPRPAHPSSAHQNPNDTSTCTYLRKTGGRPISTPALKPPKHGRSSSTEHFN